MDFRLKSPCKGNTVDVMSKNHGHFYSEYILPVIHESCEVYNFFFFLRHPFTSSIISIILLNFKSSGSAPTGSCRRCKRRQTSSLLSSQDFLLTCLQPLPHSLANWQLKVVQIKRKRGFIS